MENDLDMVLLGRLSILEFLVAQCLGMSIFNIPDKAAFLDDTRRTLRGRIDQMPIAARTPALDAMERVLSLVEATFPSEPG